MKNKIIMMVVCLSFFAMQASNADQYQVGEKRKRSTWYSRNVKPRLIPLETAFIMQINEGNIAGAIEVLDDIVIEGYLTPDVVDQISEHITYYNSISPVPGYFQPIQDRLDWLVSISKE